MNMIMLPTKPRRPIDMVVYMYLNTVTEMTYVGSSMYGLEHRHKAHLKKARAQKHRSRFYKALGAWPDEVWERIVLERCVSEQELDAAETKWVKECHALDNGVGYNTYDARYLRTSVAGGEAMKIREFTKAEKLVKSINGKKGAAASRSKV